MNICITTPFTRNMFGPITDNMMLDVNIIDKFIETSNRNLSKVDSLVLYEVNVRLQREICNCNIDTTTVADTYVEKLIETNHLNRNDTLMNTDVFKYCNIDIRQVGENIVINLSEEDIKELFLHPHIFLHNFVGTIMAMGIDKSFEIAKSRLLCSINN